MNFIKAIYYFFVRIFYRMKYKHIKLFYGVRIKHKSFFEGYNKIGPNSFFCGEIGKYSYIGYNSVVKGKIGKFCSISHNVTFLTGAHPTTKFVSTHPAFYSLGKQCGLSFVKSQKFCENPKLDGSPYSIEIGNDVFIGEGTTLIGPIRIADGAIIGAHSVVTKDVGPYEIVVGSPAKTLRKRFDNEKIEFLQNIEWWNKDKQWLYDNADLFEDIDEFARAFDNH